MLVAMVVLLLGISHLFSGEFQTNEKDNARLRHDVRDRDEVITRENVFHTFLSPEYERHEPEYLRQRTGYPNRHDDSPEHRQSDF